MTNEPEPQKQRDCSSGEPRSIAELVQRKTSGPEKGRLKEADVVFYQKEYQRLCCELESASQSSCLPGTPSGATTLDDLLVRIRVTMGSNAKC